MNAVLNAQMLTRPAAMPAENAGGVGFVDQEHRVERFR